IWQGANTAAKRQAQLDYFNSKVRYTLGSLSYQRVGENRIRVGIPYNEGGVVKQAQNVADLLQPCNYIMFQNLSYGVSEGGTMVNKWYYAFITEPPKYINNGTAEIAYEIDPLQTWLPNVDYTIDQCFVKREHSASDGIGDNLEPEGFFLNDYIFSTTYEHYNYPAVTGFTENVYVACVCDTDFQSTAMNVYDKVISGAVQWIFNDNLKGKAALKKLIDFYADHQEAILSIYSCPRYYFEDLLPAESAYPGGSVIYPWFKDSSNHTTSFTPTLDHSRTWKANLTGMGISTSSVIDGYTPKNKKLYTYPYNFLSLDNSLGDNLIMRYEYMSDMTSPKVRFSACASQPVSCVLTPANYKNIDILSGDVRNATEFITLSNFPLASWSQDYYQAYLAQNAFSETVDAGTFIAGSLSSLITGNYEGLSSIASKGMLACKEHYKAAIHADIMRGDVKSGNVNFSHGNQKFNYGRMSINRKDAVKIDGYFTAFGYATNRVKQPNIDSRPEFNYIETIGASVHGAIPADEAKKIGKIFDKGLTWWKTPAHIGDYSVNNQPT
ncbi:MAG: hypothetical protein IKY45_03255, partial [Clostridia bacterium]|nr:hypothetical protein [Clostridia bacterium]